MPALEIVKYQRHHFSNKLSERLPKATWDKARKTTQVSNPAQLRLSHTEYAKSIWLATMCIITNH